MTIEDDRAAALADAQSKAAALFARIEQSLIRPGISESQLTREIAELGLREFGIERNWHKRLVRAGANTISVYDDDPPELTLGEDDMVFVDLGPIFEAWEADFGRTYVLGNDPAKLRLRDDVATAFAAGKRYFQQHPQITGSELFRYLQSLATQAGWAFGGSIAAHLVGEYPHKSLPENLSLGYADANHHQPMRGLDSLGRQRHWILEIHFVDRQRQIGAFYEELLTVG
ncbi:M24 family metallopeptidase [Nevskia ramosa]|uniref:M24 family metallopeptidase n=1 Tax=Nevskia ramosa TaxID=64002 RepID=UPI0003B4C02E|nr:M24 family metallopeptidase [Nevskia ramosa]